MHPQMLEEAKTNYHVKNYVEYVQECYNEYLVNKFNP
jgi:hypothetical protein